MVRAGGCYPSRRRFDSCLRSLTEGQADWRRHPARNGTSFTALRVRLPYLPLETTCVLGRAAKAPVFQTGEAGSTPAGHSFELFGSVARRQSGCLLSTSARVRVPPVPLCRIAGSSLLVVMPGFEPGVRRFDSCPRSLQRTARRGACRAQERCGVVAGGSDAWL